MRRPAWSQRGDTLVEVVLALAILTGVLMGAYVSASASLRTNRASKERSQASNLIQRQAEALRNYRDNHGWRAAAPATDGMYDQVTSFAGGEFHMTEGASGWQLSSGRTTTGLFTIWITAVSMDTGDRFRFTITAEWADPGNPPRQTAIDTYLVNLDNLRPRACPAGCGSVIPANIPPVAILSADRLSGTRPLNVRFFINSSFDPDGSVVSYRLNFGDGTGDRVGNLPFPPDIPHTYNNSGTYVATLTVTDNEGATGAATVTIVVSDPLPPPPSVNFNIRGSVSGWSHMYSQSHEQPILSWSVSGSPTWCWASGSWSGWKPASGSETMWNHNWAGDHTGRHWAGYTLECGNAGGSSGPRTVTGEYVHCEPRQAGPWPPAPYGRWSNDFGFGVSYIRCEAL